MSAPARAALDAAMTEKDLRVTVPFPPKDLNPNVQRRQHWAQRAKVARDYRYQVKVDTKNAMNRLRLRGPLPTPVRLSVLFLCKDRRKRDYDNLLAMLKPALDGLVDAGLLEDDDTDHLEFGELRVLKGQDASAVELTFGAPR